METLKATAVLLALAAPALAQEDAPPCKPRAEVVALLAGSFGETPRSMGLSDAGMLLEVWASDETGTWSITFTRPDGTACLIAAGEMWEGNPPPLVTGDPA